MGQVIGPVGVPPPGHPQEGKGSFSPSTSRGHRRLKVGAAAAIIVGGSLAALWYFWPTTQMLLPPRERDDFDLAVERADYRYLQVTGNGQYEVPPKALYDAVEFRKVAWKSSKPGTVAGLPVGPPAASPAPEASQRWEWLGPRNIGGRTRAIAIHPDEPSHMWLGSVSGGVWESTDGGNTWKTGDFGLTSYAVSSLAIDPEASDTVYAGTGEFLGDGLDLVEHGKPGTHGSPGPGIYRRVSGAWEPILETINENFNFVNRLAIAARKGQPSVILAATQAGIFRSESADRKDWTKTLAGTMGEVEFHPNDPSRVVAATVWGPGHAYYSEDGGQSWKESQHPGLWAKRVELAYAHADPSVVYASVKANLEGLKTLTSHIFQSRDGGKTYSLRSTLLKDPSGTGSKSPYDYLGDVCDWSNMIWASDPEDPDLVIVGGADLYRSTDGGQTIEQISSDNLDMQTFCDHHVIIERPGYRKGQSLTVYCGSDGGVYKADDVRTVGGGDNHANGWKAMNRGYGAVQFYSASGNARTATILGGAQDNDVRIFSGQAGGPGWVGAPIRVGDGGVCVADVADETADRFYIEGQFLTIDRVLVKDGKFSEHDGVPIYGMYLDSDGSWKWKPEGSRIEDAKDRKTNFIAPFVIDPNSPDRILAGGVRLWRTENAREPVTPKSGPRWECMKETTKSGVGGRDVPISAIAIPKSKPDIIWVGYNDGQIFRTANGTSTKPSWEPALRNGLPASRYVTRIVIDPNDPERVYVAFGSYEKSNLWTLREGDSAWKSLGETLPPAPVRAFGIHPDFPMFMYVGTEVGLYCSEDAGTTWVPTSEGPSLCPVDDLFWMNKTLVTVTHGRGLFRIDLSFNHK